MECSICHVRPSVGYCKTCERQLCEVCAIPCDRCKKLLCRVHRERTPGGRNLCRECMAHREQKRQQQAAAATPQAGEQPKEDLSFQALFSEFEEELLPGEKRPETPQEVKTADYRPDWAGDAPAEPVPRPEMAKSLEDQLNARVLRGSAAREKPLWISSLKIAIFACTMVFVASRPSSFRTLVQPWLSYGIMVVGFGAVVFAISGFRNTESTVKQRRLCGIGFLLGLIAMIVAWRMA